MAAMRAGWSRGGQASSRGCSLLVLATLCVVLSCHGEHFEGVRQPFGAHEQWLSALRSAGVSSPEREVVHVSHTCDLTSDGTILHILDVREIVPFMPAPRGVNHIVVMDDDLRVVHAIGYVDQRPLRCDGDRLLLHGTLDLRDAAGNGLVFSNGGESVQPAVVDVAALPWRSEPARATERDP